MKHNALVRRAAGGRLVRLEGSFATNTAAEDLERLGTAALDEIESFFQSEATRRDLKLAGKFLGLRAVMIVYLRLGAEWDPNRTVQFLAALPTRARIEGLRASLVRWGPASGGSYGFPPEPLRALFKSLAHNGTDQERTIAKKLIKNPSRSGKSRLLARR
jgi:hypothetical protein